ncbi:MAG: rhodanese-like domain-containing protein [Saprospiraceae bacterium]
MKLSIKFNILNLLFVLVMFSCQTNTQQATTATTTTTKTVVDLTPTQFKAIATKADNIVVLDVRTPKEVAQGVIPGAKVMNFYDDNFKVELGKLDKSKTYMVYCKSGGRSGKACKALEDAGISSYHNLKGGITAWKQEGLETVPQ